MKVSIPPNLPNAYSLFHDGAIALAHVEAAGIRIDVKRLDDQIRKKGEEIRDLEEKLRKDDIYHTWRSHYGLKANLGSEEQIGHVLFKLLKHPCYAYTESSYDYKGKLRPNPRPKTNIEALEKVKLPFVKDYVRLKKLKKLKGTFLEGMRREVTGEFLYPDFKLHVARSYRSSSGGDKEEAASGDEKGYNIQNLPVRTPEYAEPLRQCIIPREGHQIVEVDFKTLEVSVAWLHHHDPTMRSYLTDPRKDMHRDLAIDLFFLKDAPKEWWKQKGSLGGHITRHETKNKFTFAEFYGSYYLDCARSLWEACRREKLVAPDGTPMKQHLKKHGVKRLGLCEENVDPQPGTFESHVCEVEHKMWYEWFPVYTAWKKAWYERYLQEGGFNYFTGFQVHGEYRRNQVICYPVQGVAFHCLLYTLILAQRWLRKHKMRSLIIGQVHDSMIGDIHSSELEDFLREVSRIVREELPRYWNWITAPLTIEAEVSAPEASWYCKKGFEIERAA